MSDCTAVLVCGSLLAFEVRLHSLLFASSQFIVAYTILDLGTVRNILGVVF